MVNQEGIYSEFLLYNRFRSGLVGLIGPEAVKIAVCPSTNIPLECREGCLWDFSSLEVLDKPFRATQYFNPFDIVRRFHWVMNGSHSHRDPVRPFFDNRDVFLVGGVNRILSLFLHRLFATDQLTLTLVGNRHNLTTGATLVDL